MQYVISPESDQQAGSYKGKNYDKANQGSASLPSFVPKQKPKSQLNRKPADLINKNNSNICFANSVIQMLNLPEFICELESQTITTDQIDNLLSLLTKMNSSKTAVDPCLYYREILKVLPEYVPKHWTCVSNTL